MKPLLLTIWKTIWEMLWKIYEQTFSSLFHLLGQPRAEAPNRCLLSLLPPLPPYQRTSPLEREPRSRHGEDRGGFVGEDLGKTQDISFFKVFFWNHEASFWVCISQLFEYSDESWSVGNHKLVWRRKFITQIRDPIYVGSLRPERGNFLTLILTDFETAKLLCRVLHSGRSSASRPHLWHWLLRHLALRLSPSEQSQRRSRLWILWGCSWGYFNGCNHGMLTRFDQHKLNMGPQNLWSDMMISAQHIS